MAIPLFLTALTVFSSCETTSLQTRRDSTSAESQALGEVAGVWLFSHAGPPSISNSATSSIISEVRRTMTGSKISIQEDGAAAFVALGQSMGFEIVVVEETPIYIKLSVPGEKEKGYTYDKRTKLLSLSMDLDADGQKGFVPAYYKRIR